MRKNNGAAIVMAMLLAAFAATIAATLLWQQQRWINDHAHRRDQVQSQALAMAGIHWARQILYDDQRTTSIDHLGEPWALRLPATPIENGSIAGFIVDAQGMLDVNSLGRADTTTQPSRPALLRLFTQLGIPPALLDSMNDWVDADNVVRAPGGAEDAFYLGQNPPLLAANAPVLRFAEMLAVRGATAPMIARLQPFVGAMPESTPLNVNTAPPEVLAAAIDGLDADGTLALVASRKLQPFGTVADFKSRLPKPDLVTNDQMFAVRSNYFIVSVEARQNDTIARARALLKRNPSDWPSVVWQIVE